MKIILLFVCLAIGGISAETIGGRPKRASGGDDIPVSLAQYFASLRRERIHICGGGFITSQHVLTAASCVIHKSNNFRMNMMVTSTGYEKSRIDVEYSILSISAHISYMKGDDWCDVAVITIDGSVNWNTMQGPLLLPDAEPAYFDDAILTSLEYTMDTAVREDSLQQLKVKMFPYTQVFRNAEAGDYAIFGITSYGQTDLLDDGAPLVRNKRIVGIALPSKLSERHRCYFVNVFKFRRFIEQCLPW